MDNYKTISWWEKWGGGGDTKGKNKVDNIRERKGRVPL